MLLIETEIPGAREQTEFRVRDLLRQYVHDAADRIRSVERRARSFQHLHAGNHFERDRQIEIEVPGLHIIDAHAVEQNQGLAEGRAADREIGLESARRALLQVERRIELQQIEPRAVERELLLRQLRDAHIAIRFRQRDRFRNACHNDAFLPRRRDRLRRYLLCAQRGRDKKDVKNEGPDSHGIFHRTIH